MSKTVAELKMEARELGIKLPAGAKKAQIVEALEAQGKDTISSEDVNGPSVSSESKTKSLENETVGSVLPVEPKPEQPVVSENKVALYSERNLSWGGVGKLEKGYNFVTKAKSERWLTQRSVRAATPEEVKGHYGV